MTRKEALRLEYLDGLRAVAALYVVLFHAGLGFLDAERPLHGFARNLQRALSFGHDAVAVFIVLSGYCLMLPVARAPVTGQLVRGIPNYIARRAWRILPPYFAALLGTLLLIALAPVLETPTKTIWADSFPAFEFGANRQSPTADSQSRFRHGPIASMGRSGAWQRSGRSTSSFRSSCCPFGAVSARAPTLLIAFALGGGLTWLAPDAAGSAASWYFGLFGLGMCAAGIDFAARPAEQRLRERVPWPLAEPCAAGRGRLRSDRADQALVSVHAPTATRWSARPPPPPSST